MKRSRNREYVIVTYVILAMLISLCGYFVYFMYAKSETFIDSSYNRRLNNLSAHVIRGDIITDDGVVIATTVNDNNGDLIRYYPQKNLYAHAVGYVTNGMSGMEKDENFELLRSHSFIVDRLKNEIFNEKNKGDTVISTLNSKVQETAYKGLDWYKGAVIAMDPTTGEIICVVSRPDFNPNTIADDWETLSSDTNSSVLLNRATQGLYPPGSTFKIITALEYLREGGSAEDNFNCTGKLSEGDHTIHCYHGTVHGNINFLEAFAKSCNTTFAKIGLNLNKNSYKQLAESLFFNKTLPTNLSNVSKSKFSVDSSTGNALMMQTSFGQGDTLVTPIHMMLIASIIANDGVLMKPHMVKEIINEDEEHVSYRKPETYGTIISSEESQTMKEYMRKVVTDGTGSVMNDAPYTAYGKTGTAEFSSNENEAHSWFVGFAEMNGKQLAIAVIIEGAGSGSKYAAPLAKEVFNAYFNNL